MKTRVKHRSVLATLIFALCAVISAIIAIAFLTVPSRTALAEDSKENAHGYYYSQLKNSKIAERLYDALWDMYEKGYFEKCTEQYDLTTVLTQRELGDYVINKTPTIPVALGAARDAFYLDHPELFYVSVHDMRFIFGSDGTKYSAYLGAGKADNYYEEYTATSAEEVKAAVADFNVQLDKAVAAAKKDNANVVRQIRNANEYLCNIAEYDFGAYDDKHGGLAYNGYVNTAYGILNSQEGKAGKALCEGYAKAFKVIMDKLGIPCVLVAGPACSGLGGVDGQGNRLESTYEPHMWNAVKVDGQWYGVDVCWNDTENNHGKYTLVGEMSLMKYRYEDPVISSSEFKVKYPVLRVLDYNVNDDGNGFEFKDSGKVGGQVFSEETGMVGVSYENKNFKQLKADGKYLAMCLGTDEPWIDYNVFNDVMGNVVGTGDFVAGKYTTFLSNMFEEFIQFAVIDVAPDCDGTYFGTALPNACWTNLTSDHILAVSAKYNNQDFGVAKGKPHIKSMTPNASGYIRNFDPTDISITYDEQLVYADHTTTEVGIEVTAERRDIKIKVENVVWHEDTNTITFTFTPSKAYAHNGLAYYLTPTNLIGKNSGETPDAAMISFQRVNTSVICPKVFNDGRLFIKIYGEPKFVSASDESLNQFKDKDGQPIVNQRSQLMLVVNRPTDAENEQMAEAAKKLGDRILQSETYQIDLQICGCLQKVPDGSYMQVGFGFPEGFGPEDAGVSFTVYHYKKNADGTIKEVEPVPCIVNEYGIIATVKSFSPFMICAVDSDSKSVKNLDKRVLASIDGVGGNIDKKDIISVASGSSVTYTITEDEGYTVDRVLVNGEDKKSSVVDGKLTLDEADLNANNTVVVSFISDRAAKFISDNQINVVEHDLIVTEKDMIVAYVAPNPKAPDDSNVGLIVTIVVVVIVLAAAAAVALFFVFRKKREAQKATAGKGKTSKIDSAKAKPESKKTTGTTVNKSVAATTTAQRPTTAAQRPATTAAQRPTTAAQRPANATPNKPSSANAQRPATQRPTAQRSATTVPTRSQSNTAHKKPTGAQSRPTQQRPQSGVTRHASADRNKKK